mmetsp:Transcript_45697/g.106069  ORF Transcript_45697/g.106069 Transcript_45697/m.106069 type:complete len:201 (-) Transcript_45697:36-638(-)
MPRHLASIYSFLQESCNLEAHDAHVPRQTGNLARNAPTATLPLEPMAHHIGRTGRAVASAFIGGSESEIELLGSSRGSKPPAVKDLQSQARLHSSFASASGGGLPNDNNEQCGNGGLSLPCQEPFLIKWSGPWKTIQMLQDMEEHRREVQFWGTAITGTTLGLFVVLFPRLLASVRKRTEPQETYAQKLARAEREAARMR